MHGKIVGTQPVNILDFVLWPLLELIGWERLTRKSSYWWHWRSYHGPIDQTIHVAGDSSLSLHSRWHGVSLGTICTWQQVVVLEAVDPVVYQIGFRSRGVCQLCSIQVRGAIAMLRGPEDTEFFGVTADGQPLALRNLGHSTRWKPFWTTIVL